MHTRGVLCEPVELAHKGSRNRNEVNRRYVLHYVVNLSYMASWVGGLNGTNRSQIINLSLRLDSLYL